MSLKSAIFCYAAADTDLVREIGQYLKTNLPYEPSYEECVIRPGFTIVDATGRALSGDLALVVLSPESVLPRWDRPLWEPVLIDQAREFGANLVFLAAGECKFPPVLRKIGFVDFIGDRQAALRALKRHLIQREQPGTPFDLPPLGAGLLAEIEGLRTRAADSPASIAGVPRDEALQFAHACREDFQGAFWIDATRRSIAGVLGDTAQALGLRLSGSVDQNFEAIRSFCDVYRCLFVFDQLDPALRDWINFSGRSSVILTEPGEPRSIAPYEQVQPAFSNWAKDPGPCVRSLGDVMSHLQDASHARRLGSACLAFLKSEERLAEADEVLEVLIRQAGRSGDSEWLRQLQWDRSWILGHWGEPYRWQVLPTPTSDAASQLGFSF